MEDSQAQVIDAIRRIQSGVRWKPGQVHSVRAGAGDEIVNELVQAYVVDTQYPDVSGIEHIQMLQRRSELAALEQSLSRKERRQLAEADARLVAHASEFLVEIARFVDLSAERRRLDVPASHWWWYLDVLVQVPGLSPRGQEPELAAT